MNSPFASIALCLEKREPTVTRWKINLNLSLVLLKYLQTPNKAEFPFWCINTSFTVILLLIFLAKKQQWSTRGWKHYHRNIHQKRKRRSDSFYKSRLRKLSNNDILKAALNIRLRAVQRTLENFQDPAGGTTSQKIGLFPQHLWG